MTAIDVHVSDLGRRVAEARERAGLSQAEAAARSGLAPRYLEYLETGPAPDPGPGSLLRLAAVLGTSPEALTGAAVYLPPGQRDACPRPVIQKLSLAECRDRLAAGGIGRFLFSASRGPVALPVNFGVLGGDIVFRTAGGQAAAAVRQRRVSFEVDRVDDALAEGWSVLVSGHARTVSEDAELAEVAALGIKPWAGGNRDVYIRLAPRYVTGRRIRAIAG